MQIYANERALNSALGQLFCNSYITGLTESLASACWGSLVGSNLSTPCGHGSSSVFPRRAWCCPTWWVMCRLFSMGPCQQQRSRCQCLSHQLAISLQWAQKMPVTGWLFTLGISKLFTVPCWFPKAFTVVWKVWKRIVTLPVQDKFLHDSLSVLLHRHRIRRHPDNASWAEVQGVARLADEPRWGYRRGCASAFGWS